jgi:hypothetical protein
MARRDTKVVRQPGGGRWVVRTNPTPAAANESELPLEMAILLEQARAAGARVGVRRTEVGEGYFTGDQGRGKYVRVLDVTVIVPPGRGAKRMGQVLSNLGFRSEFGGSGVWSQYVRPRSAQRNPAERAGLRALPRGGVAARTPPMHIVMRSRGGGDPRQLATMLKAHGFRRSGRSWSLDLPGLDVEAHATRANPAGQVVTPYDLRPGDTIMLEDLGRMHVIEGPFRSGRGIRFVNEYGNGLVLAPNERVLRLARDNPRVEADTRVGALQQRVAKLLDSVGLIGPRTRFRETSRGGLQVTHVDARAVGQNELLEDRLARAASVAGFDFELGGDGLLMLPFGERHPEGQRRFYANPTRGRRTRRAPSGSALPEAEIRFIVDRFHVGTPDAEVEADIRRRTASWPPASQEEAVEYAIKRHHANQDLYRGVMRGRFNNPHGVSTERGMVSPSGRVRHGTHGFYAVDVYAPAIYRSSRPIRRALPLFSSEASAEAYAARAGAPSAPVIDLDRK